MAMKITSQNNQTDATKNNADVNKLLKDGKAGKATKEQVQQVKDELTKSGGLNAVTASGRQVGEVLDDMLSPGNFAGPPGSKQSNAAWTQDLNDLATGAGARSDGTVAGDGSVIATMEKQAAQTLPTSMASDTTLQKAWGDGTTPFAKQLMDASPALKKDFNDGRLGKEGDAKSFDFNKIQGDLAPGATSLDGMVANGQGAVSLYRSPTDGTTLVVDANKSPVGVNGFDAKGASQQTTNATKGNHDQYFTSGSATIYVGTDKSVRPFDQTTDYEKNKANVGADWQTKAPTGMS